MLRASILLTRYCSVNGFTDSEKVEKLGRQVRDFGLEMRGLFRWAGVSSEDGFVCRIEGIWRLGAAVLARAGMRAPAGTRDVCCQEYSGRGGDMAGESVVSQEATLRRRWREPSTASIPEVAVTKSRIAQRWYSSLRST